MTTISITEETRKRLLKIAGELQRTTGDRVDFDTVISYLTTKYAVDRGNLDAFRLFCSPIPNVRFQDLYTDLVAERKKDEGQR